MPTEKVLRGPQGAHGDCAMSFAEIGRRQGISTANAYDAYRSGLDKLSRMPGCLKLLADLAGELDRNRRTVHSLTDGEL